MGQSVAYEEAWNSLKEHWYIPPHADRIEKTPVYGILRLVFAPFIRTCLRMKYRGLHHIPRTGATILAANHLSHIDPIVVIASSRRTTHYLAKDGHFSNPLTRLVMTSTGQIKTERESGGGNALSSAATVLASERALGIFPEGTRSKRTEAPFLLEGKTGVARLAASYPHARVVPIALIGTRNVMAPKIHKIPRLWKPIKVQAGLSVSWMEWLSSSSGSNRSPEDIQALSNQSHEVIKSELAQLYREFTNQLMTSLKQLGAA